MLGNGIMKVVCDLKFLLDLIIILCMFGVNKNLNVFLISNYIALIKNFVQSDIHIMLVCSHQNDYILELFILYN